MIDISKLSEPFSPDKIHWRVGAKTKDNKKGMALAYIDARDVMERLDEVCGPENWQRRYVDAGNGRTCCEVGINVLGLFVDFEGSETPKRVMDHWVWKSDGAGDTDYEAEKGAFSDAFKRAAVNWGIGRYLYDLDSPWVELEERGKSHVIKSSEKAKLARVLGGPAPTQSNPKYSAAEIEKIAGALSDGLEILLKANPTRDQLVEWREQNAAQISTLTDKLRGDLWAVYEPALKKSKELEPA